MSIALIALVEIPAYLRNDNIFTNHDHKGLFSVNAFSVDIIGRKPIILLSLVVASIVCVIPLSLQENNYWVWGCLLILKSTVAGVFTLIR